MNYNFRLRLTLLLVLIVVLLLSAIGCVSKLQTKSLEIPDTQSLEEQTSAPVRDLVLSYIHNERTEDGSSVYFASDEPDEPQERDFRIDSLVYAGETNLQETVGVAYEIKYSLYWLTRSSRDAEGVYGWHQNTSSYVILSRSGYGNRWDRVLGISYEPDSNKKIEDIILEVAYGIWDIDMSVKFDDHPCFVGPGSVYIPLEEEPSIEILKEYEPIYAEGDYWLQLNYEGLTVWCCHNAADGTNRVYNIETVRTDVATYHGIRIGMGRDKVLSAYLAINDTQYWDYEGDYLWHCKDEEGYGASLIFWFQDDIVTKIEIINIFD